MRLALLGKNISHSLSPSLYREILGHELESYELIDAADPASIPSLAEMARTLNGLNITAPYKKHFFSQVITSEILKRIGAINCIAFGKSEIIGTNTDYIATREILQRMTIGEACQLILLGSGSMATMTKIIAEELGLPLKQYSRSTEANLSGLDLRSSHSSEKKTIIINSCSRDFIFQGLVHHEAHFWDYNYNFSPHSQSLPSRVKTYTDGTELLRLQAIAAVNFWRENKL